MEALSTNLSDTFTSLFGLYTEEAKEAFAKGLHFDSWQSLIQDAQNELREVTRTAITENINTLGYYNRNLANGQRLIMNDMSL